VLDRATGRVVMMASEEGGTEIEEVAEHSPEKIFKEIVDPAVGLQAFQARKLAYAINIPNELVNKAVKFMVSLYTAFVEKDASIAEINPLVVTGDGQVIALDAKLNFDSNALYRHKDIVALRDLEEEDATLRLTATSAVSLTERVWLWRRWTSSNTTAATLPTS
jgi:succinyl-CoA synthetase beta subunit